ncbi:hypothetical protein [uncultured Dechloromonas sp.]|uniref:hypothetical protein n=1 Tax=uncultured Dechloromonas sp. TaxID=171719 RepID=UPI0025EE986E|nr:hypothetical protein [uncultured Dechloromonas sp.]
MTTSNKPENLNTNEAHDLGQISIKPLRLEPIYIANANGSSTRVAVSYYGTAHNTIPDETAQVVFSCGSFDAAIHAKAQELRRIASQLCEAAAAIEAGQQAYDEATKYNRYEE